MIHRRSGGIPWGNVSNGLEGRGSDALGWVFVSDRSILVSSMEVERCQSVWVQMQVGGKLCCWGTCGTFFRMLLLSQWNKNQSQQLELEWRRFEERKGDNFSSRFVAEQIGSPGCSAGPLKVRPVSILALLLPCHDELRSYRGKCEIGRKLGFKESHFHWSGSCHYYSWLFCLPSHRCSWDLWITQYLPPTF